MTDPSRYRQEFEIDFSATLGERVFDLHEEATLCKSFPIPPSWTRYMALDPHERKPHAALWCAVSPNGDRWYYRELWPSVAQGKSQDPPKDEKSPFVKDYVQAMQWLESKGNPENEDGDKSFDEDILRRVIDYAARSFGIGSSDDEPQENMQVRFQEKAQLLDPPYYLHFEDCKKDTNASVELVNQGLQPIEILDPKTDTYVMRSRVHIFEDRCPELVWELRNNRWSELTPLQAERQDVSTKQIEKRKHLTDCLRYIESANPIYIKRERVKDTWRPVKQGVNW